MNASNPASPPEGFVPSTGRGGFSTHNGPYWRRENGDVSEQAFFAEARHCNGLGVIHGGMLCAFLDGVMAGAATRGTGLTPVTMHLSQDFLAMGRAGEWVMGEARLLRAAGDLAFVEGRARVRGRELARAMGIFKLLRRRT